MDLAALAVRIMELLGGPGIALVLAAEALFPPVPGEVLLPFAGVTAAANGEPIWVPIFWTTLGSVVGGIGVYAVGRALGLHRTRRLISRLPLLEEHDVDVAVRFFDKYGFPAVAIARFVPMVRTFISIPAGIEKMPLWLFALATGLGSGIWNAAFVVAGYLFGQAGGETLEAFVRIYSSIVAGLGILAGIGFLTQRWRSRRADGAETDGPSAEGVRGANDVRGDEASDAAGEDCPTVEGDHRDTPAVHEPSTLDR